MTKETPCYRLKNPPDRKLPRSKYILEMFEDETYARFVN